MDTKLCRSLEGLGGGVQILKFGLQMCTNGISIVVEFILNND